MTARLCAFASLFALAAGTLAHAQTPWEAMQFPRFSESRLTLLVRWDVSDELGLSRLDQQRIVQAIDEVLGHRHRPGDPRAAIRGEVRRDEIEATGNDLSRAEDAVYRLLSPERRNRLAQLTLQVQGGFALDSAQLRRDLRLSYDQERWVAELLANYHRETPSYNPTDPDPVRSSAVAYAVRDDYRRRLVSVLSPDQFGQFVGMLGRQFTMERGGATYYEFPGRARRRHR